MNRVSTYSYLAVLSVADTVVLFVGLFRMWMAELTGNDVRNRTQWTCKTINALGSIISDYSVWLIVAVTFERYVAVCRPLAASEICRKSRAFAIMAALLVLLTCTNVHFFWTTELHDVTQCDVTAYACEPAEGYAILVVEIWPWVDALIYSLLPLFMIVVFNSLIIRTLAHSNRHRDVTSTRDSSRGMLRMRRSKSRTLSGECSGGGGVIRKSSSSSESSTRLTVMLLTVSFTFLITTLPMNITLICTTFWNSYAKDVAVGAKFKLIRTIAEMLMYANHSMNFFLYCATGNKFRQELLAVFRRKKNPSLSVRQQTIRMRLAW